MIYAEVCIRGLTTPLRLSGACTKVAKVSKVDLQAVTTNPEAVKINNSFVEYHFYTFTAATPEVSIFTLPTHPLYSKHSIRYAVSVDNGPLKIIDFRTFGRSEEWKQNVLRNRAEQKVPMPFPDKGNHTLRIYCVDPEVILDEMRINSGGLKKAYSTVPETKTLAASKITFKQGSGKYL